MPSARSFMAASVFDGSLHIFGGTVDQNTRSNELYRFKVGLFLHQIFHCKLYFFSVTDSTEVYIT